MMTVRGDHITSAHLYCIRNLQKITKSFEKSEQCIGPREPMGRAMIAAPLPLLTVGTPHSLARNSGRWNLAVGMRLVAAEQRNAPHEFALQWSNNWDSDKTHNIILGFH
jgi:hypothetical protein